MYNSILDAEKLPIMTENYSRNLIKKIRTAMTDTPVILINGPRQSGKTTLVQHYRDDMSYYTLDDNNILNTALQDPIGFIERMDKAIIDEIQRAPELLRSIKLFVDRDRRPGRFILTGSANLLAMPKIGDSLAGRMEILTLYPLSLTEIQRNENAFLTMAESQTWPTFGNSITKIDCIQTALQGGYPEMLSRSEPSRRIAWARSYIKTIIERDAKDIASIEKLIAMPSLLAILAEYSGKLPNFTQIGGQAGLDTKTTQKYVSILENLYLVKRLLPWHKNRLNRLIKTPKLYFLDSGLLASLGRITKESILDDYHRFGALLETWVFGELLKAISVSEEPWDIFYYRDKDQVEVDFILERGDGKMIGIEVKASKTIFPHDFNSLKKLAALSEKQWISGIVLYDGDYCLSFGPTFWAIPFSLFGF